MNRMKNILFGLILFSFVAINALSQAPATLNDKDFIRIDANSSKGFAYPYYLYIPPEVRDEKARDQTQTILVLPNNTGQISDEFAVHEADVKKRMGQAGAIASLLKVAVLMPVFPRPKTDWQIYTQALDRDSMVTDKTAYRRLDLQLVAMIDDARAKMRSAEKLKFDKRILINGFSAQGMFANRFTFLHPDRVKAAVIGSPGGWPIAPADKFKERTLRYPIGTSDLKTVAGRKLDLKTLRKVPLFIFIGDRDENDSVVFGDSYDEADKDLIFEIFGKTPVSRWEASRSLYKAAGLNAEFKLYPGVPHTVTPLMRDDIRAFLLKNR